MNGADGQPLAGSPGARWQARPARTTITTGADGRADLAISQAGDYTVTLDTSTLPAGQTLSDPTATSSTVSVALGGPAFVAFKIGPPDGGSTATATPGDHQLVHQHRHGSDPTTDGPAVATSTNRVAQQFANGLVFGLLLALASVGLSLVYGTTGLSTFSHGEQVTLGAIAAYVLVQNAHLPLWAAAALAVVIGGASGWLQDAGIWRPLRRTPDRQHPADDRHDRPVDGAAVPLPVPVRRRPPADRHLGVRAGRRSARCVLSVQTLVSAVIAIVVLGGVAYFLLYTRTGRATRAVSDNPALAAASGIGVEHVIRTVWVGARRWPRSAAC